MLGVLGVLVAIVFWRFLVIFGTTVFETVGLSRTAAGFESRSAIVGAGYTTARSERVIDDPASRRVAAMLVVVGYFGPTVVVGLLGISFVTPTNDDPVNRWVVLLALLVVLYVLDRLGVFRALATAPAQEPITTHSLLLEMVDLDRLARSPDSNPLILSAVVFRTSSK